MGRGFYRPPSGSQIVENAKQHEGMFTSVHKHEGGLTIFTGSLFGFGAGLMFGSGSSIAGNVQGAGKVTLAGGGDINFQDLADANSGGYSGNAVGSAKIMPISLFSISSSTAEPPVYTFKKKTI